VPDAGGPEGPRAPFPSAAGRPRPRGLVDRCPSGASRAGRALSSTGLNASPISFDAVLFDLDGTLVATDRFWLEAAERGARRAFRALGLERGLPTRDEWLSLVGLPLDGGFRALFPDLGEAQRKAVLTACVEEEEELLRVGGAPAMPFVRETVRELADLGLALGIASNCTASYLAHMLDGLDLRDLVRAAVCRESPGIENKADMIERLLLEFGTRSAVMVGDRKTDRDAAWDNGIPHVHCSFGFAQGDEHVEAEGRIQSLDELAALLRRRATWIASALRDLGASEAPGMRIGIAGARAAGKTLFARDAERLLRARGTRARAIALDAFASDGGSATPAEVDVERLEREVLAPHARGERVVLESAGLPAPLTVEPGAVLLLEGSIRSWARLRPLLDRLVFIDVSPEVQLRRRTSRHARRTAGREPHVRAPEALEPSEPVPPGVDLTLDGSNPLGPTG